MLFLLDFICFVVSLFVPEAWAMYGPLEDTLAHAGPHQLGITVQYIEPGCPADCPPAQRRLGGQTCFSEPSSQGP